MSGGVAYIFDESGDFVQNCLNPDMVNVYQLIECGDAEINQVKAKIETHVELTGSERGKAILANWPAIAEKFLKIMPQDYERVLQAQARAEERGLKGDDAILAAFEENVKAGH
jgi:glutamate synthase (ferredoxin)